MDYNSDFKYDLKVGQVKEKELGDIFAGSLVEVKHDLRALDTGNIFVEYESRGKPSGMSTSKAEWYCYAFGDTFHLIKLDDLKQRCRKYIGSRRDVVGGDNNTSKGILLPLKDLM